MQSKHLTSIWNQIVEDEKHHIIVNIIDIYVSSSNMLIHILK